MSRARVAPPPTEQETTRLDPIGTVLDQVVVDLSPPVPRPPRGAWTLTGAELARLIGLAELLGRHLPGETPYFGVQFLTGREGDDTADPLRGLAQLVVESEATERGDALGSQTSSPGSPPSSNWLRSR